MPARLDMDLRPATLDDVEMVANLEAARDPEDPRDPQMLRHWWSRRTDQEITLRLVAKQKGAAVAFVAAGHEDWKVMPKRFGWVRPILDRDRWSEAGFRQLVETAEAWLRSEGAVRSVIRIREDFSNELEAVGRAGYREERRQRISELDLVAGRDALLAGAEAGRSRMREEGVTLLTLGEDRDPERMTKLYELSNASEQDIPTSVPIRTMPFEEWRHEWLDDPGVREDRFHIAREGDAIVGLSVIGYPPVRGLPWTFYTGTSKAVRGRGIARALKYETVAQAIDLGFERIRTNNDAANGPILRLNEQIGYRLVRPLIELHRELS
jgi:RimJ/RimL family protein N-acetyltransferase